MPIIIGRESICKEIQISGSCKIDQTGETKGKYQYDGVNQNKVCELNNEETICSERNKVCSDYIHE